MGFLVAVKPTQYLRGLFYLFILIVLNSFSFKNAKSPPGVAAQRGPHFFGRFHNLTRKKDLFVSRSLKRGAYILLSAATFVFWANEWKDTKPPACPSFTKTRVVYNHPAG